MMLVKDGLMDYNKALLGNIESDGFGCFVRDDDGKICGGVTGWIHDEMAMVRFFWVDEKLRGQGVSLQVFILLEVELKKRNVHEIHVATYSVQAPEFYKKIGFIEIARIEFMKKYNVEKIFFIKEL